MANSKTPSAKQKEHYKAYASQERWKKNREKKLERHLQKHPNDKQAEQAVGNVKYRRKKPMKKVWSKERIEMAQMYKKVGSNGNRALR